MNPETLAMATLNSVLDMLLGDSVAAIAAAIVDGIAAAIVDGNPTDEQLAEYTRMVHAEFDAYDGCMVLTIREMSEAGIPHYAINHAIRTYVRLNDKRETEAAQKGN